jgi:hypothetical protein
MSKLEADINALLVTDQARAFLLLVAREEFWKRTAEGVATAIGLKNRDALRNRLLLLNLPPWRVLRRWFRVYALVAAAEEGKSFASSALSDGHNPSSTYRSLESLLKMNPGAILRRGGTALLLPELVRELDKIHQALDLGRNTG